MTPGEIVLFYRQGPGEEVDRTVGNGDPEIADVHLEGVDTREQYEGTILIVIVPILLASSPFQGLPSRSSQKDIAAPRNRSAAGSRSADLMGYAAQYSGLASPKCLEGVAELTVFSQVHQCGLTAIELVRASESG
jgi:hypothetical protein